MSWDESLFGFFYRAMRAGKRELERKSPDELARTVSFAETQAPLRLFASALAGVTVEISEAELVGGTRGATILLPKEISFAPSRDANAAALLLRTAYAATSIRLGFHWSGDDTARGLATLLAVRATRDALEAELPRAREVRDALAPSLLASRPNVGSLPPQAQRLEALIQALVGRSLGDLAADAPAAAAWVTEVLDGPPATPDTLPTCTARWLRDAGGEVAPVALWGTLYAPLPTGRDAAVTSGALGDAGVRTERKAKPREAVERVVLKRREADAENPVIHSFEKLHTAEEHKGGDKRADGADELADHAEALDELDLREVVRSTEQARSLYRAELTIDGPEAGEADAAQETELLYDEWDDRVRRYRADWCCLRSSPADPPLDMSTATKQAKRVRARHRATIEALRGELEELDRARRWHNRQTEGPEVDVDAVVDRHAALQSGRAGPEKLYLRRRRREQDVAVLILLDASLSTDAWVDGRRVIDVARDSVVVLGSVLRDVDVDTSIGAFFSNTRRDCRFLVVKRFEDDWSTADRRLMGVEPAGYTRIGPAIRHGSALLDGHQARRKLLLLVSDGKPSDYDRYEGRYGVADVRQATREAAQKGITTFGLAIDPAARLHLPQMFGRGGYEALPKPEALVLAMARVFRDLLR